MSTTYFGKGAATLLPLQEDMAHDLALGKVMQLLLKDDAQVCKQFVENESFKRFVSDMVYTLTNP